MAINKTLQKAQILTRLVTGALNEHAIPASVALDVERERAGKRPYNKVPFLTALSASLPAVLADYAQAQGHVEREVSEDGGARDGRDEAVEALRASASRTARSIEAIFGRKALVKTLLVGTVPPVPDALLTFTSNFLNTTGEQGFKLPDPITPHASLDFAAARADIAEGNAALKAALEGVVTDNRQTQRARSERNDAHNTWLIELRFARDMARAVLTRAGKADLAARVLPTDRQIDGDDPIDGSEGGGNA